MPNTENSTKQTCMRSDGCAKPIAQSFLAVWSEGCLGRACGYNSGSLRWGLEETSSKHLAQFLLPGHGIGDLLCLQAKQELSH
eukprot:6460669-Amphidinium_carterae.1